MDGLLLIDKPKGITSFDVVRQVRRLVGTRRVGHTGTLDPMATGVLPVAVGEGTRLVQFLLEGDKEYRATLRLGQTTDTQDADGVVLLERPVGEISLAELQQAVESLTGPIQQLPPMYSAIKMDGVPLYRLARRGIEVERPMRTVFVERIEVLRTALPEIEISVTCSKGTYVRTLAHDLGERLGVGAHLAALRRVRSGPFKITDCVSLDDLARMVAEGRPPLLGLRQAMHHLPALEVTADAQRRLRCGIPPALGDCSPPAELEAGEVVLLVNGECLLAIALLAPGRERESRGDFELLRVFTGGGAAD